MSRAEASNDPPKKVAKNDTATGIALSEILFLQRTLLLGALPLSLEHGILDPSDFPSSSEESLIRRKEHQIPTKPKIGTGLPLKVSNTKLKTINQKIYPRLSAVYHTLLKPGYATLNGFPDIPKAPDIFRGLRYSPSKDIAVGDIDYSKKRTVELKTDLPYSGFPGTILQDRITDNKTASGPAQAVYTTLESYAESEVSETDTSDNGVSLYLEPDTPQSPPAPKIMRYPDPLNPTNASIGLLNPPEDLHTKPRSPPESPAWGLDNCSSEAAPKENVTSPGHEIEQHGPFNKSTSSWQNYRELCNGLLDVRKYALRSEKEVQRLQTRVRFLEKKVGIEGKPQKAKKNRRPPLVGGGGVKITRAIQHISHLIELRRFMEKLKKKTRTRLKETKGVTLPATLNH